MQRIQVFFDIIRTGTFLMVLMFLSSITDLGAQVKIKKLDINSTYEDFSPTIVRNGLVFCSNRKSSGLVQNFDENGMPNSNFYKALYSDGKFNEPTLLSPSFDAEFNQGPVAFTKDQQTIIFTQNVLNPVNEKEQVLGLFYSEKYDSFWSKPKSLDVNSPLYNYSVAHPSLSEDGTTLYFCSDMPGGYGGYDIYKVELQQNGKCGAPMNLGENVNGPGNEAYPFISGDYKIYFSSNRNEKTTGVDIFYSQIDQQTYSIPERMDAPINSPDDDFNFIVDEMNQNGFFCTNRVHKVKSDIYQVAFKEDKLKDCQESLKPSFCYIFKDTNFTDFEDRPVQFIWKIGKTDVLYGQEVEYCFDGYGEFNIELSLLDTVTGQEYNSVAQYTINVDAPEFPFIELEEDIYSTKFSFFELSDLDNVTFEVQDIFWDFGDLTNYKGQSVEHLFETAGPRTIYVGVEGMLNNEPHFFCLSKSIEVKSVGGFKSFKKL